MRPTWIVSSTRLEQIFDHIMKRLKARGVTYAECADALQLQLPRPVR
jgi:hypothetical protein